MNPDHLQILPDHEEPEQICWEQKIPLITNPWLVLQGIAIPGLTGLILGAIFWLITGASDMVFLFLAIGGGLALIFLFVMFVLQLVGGGLATTFCINSRGVCHKAGKRTRSINRMAVSGSVIGGSMPGTGAGLIAMSQESKTLEWTDVRYISIYPGVRSLVFRQKHLLGPVVLYCTEENFAAVRALAERYAPLQATRITRF